MSLPGIVDYPDWNPPRDRPSFRSVETLSASLLAGDSVNVPLDPEQVDAAVIVQGSIEPGMALHLGSPVVFGPIENQRGVINIGPDPLGVTLVSSFIGAGMQLEIANASLVTVAYVLFVTTVAGVQTDLVLPQQQMAVKNAVAVPAGGDADAFTVGLAGEYTRATIAVDCDQPYTVTVRRSWLDSSGALSIVSIDELVATVAGAGASFTDTLVGANGYAVIVSGTGATPGTAQIAVRLYRAGGY